MRKAIAAVFCLLFCISRVFAQGSELYYNLSIGQGLSDVSVNAITQDKYGYIWIGTSNGLNRYDGYSIRTFYADARNQLPSNNIISLYSDSEGRLWVGTGKGLAEYDFINETFSRRIDSNSLGFDVIYCLIEDTRKNLYIGAGSGVYYYDKQRRQLQDISAQYARQFPIKRAKGLLLADPQTLYVSTEKMGFYRLHLDTRKGEQFSFSRLKVSVDTFLHTNKLLRADDSTLLMGTLSIGVLKFNTRSGQFSWPQKAGPLQRNPGILYNTVREFTRDHSNRVWIASHYFGLAEYFPRNDSIAIPAVQPYTPYSFEGRNAQCIFEDRQHNLWVGTLRNGVYRFRPNQKSVYFYAQNELDKNALQTGAVVAIAGLDSNTLMIGTSNGPSFYNRQTGQFRNFRGQAHYAGGQALEQASSALKDTAGNIWIGTNRLGLMKFSPGLDHLSVFTRFTENNPVHADGVSKMLPLTRDTLLLINFGTISLLDRNQVRSRSFHNDSTTPLLQLNGIADACYSRDNRLIWIARANGDLYTYEPARRLLVRQPALFDSFSMPVVIYHISTDHRDRLWCATNIGALCIERGAITKRFSIRGSRNPNEITNILPYKDELWITNSRSLARLYPDNGSMTILGQKEGFRDVKLFAASLSLSPWGTIMIGSSNGFFEILPEQVTATPTSLPAYLISFRIYDEPYQTDKVISEVKEIRLSPRQNFFSFDFSTFDYNETNDIEYAYFLEGFDEQWHSAGSRRNGSYTNVPGGTYTLRLRARNSSGIWNEKGQRIRIIIDQPFWKTTWFIGLSLLVLAGSIVLLYRYRINSFKRREQLRLNYEIKLNELENSALRTQMNPHFIFNSLNTINSFINSNSATKANQYISKFSKLIRLILDHSREKKIVLSDELQVAELYIQLEKIRFDNKFRHQVIISDDLDPESVVIPPLIIQPFIENAILHGLLPSGREGLLSLIISRQDGQLLIVIEDNGIGRAGRQAMKSPDDQKRKSHGIDITIKRIALFNNTPDAQSTVRIIDLHNEQGQAAGTRVELLIGLEERY